MHIGVATHLGLVRSVNEDTILSVPGQSLFIVADGLGGHPCGDVASRLAVETVERQLARGASLTEAIVEADLTIAGASLSNPGCAGMGTTIVVFKLMENGYQLAWVGDSRIYRVNQGIQRLTRDHGLVQDLLDSGTIDEEEARNHPYRNIINRYVGDLNGRDYAVDERKGKVKQGDTFLLSTDGLHDLVRDDDICQSVQRAETSQLAAEALVRKALDAGGTDNVSVIVVQTD